MAMPALPCDGFPVLEACRSRAAGHTLAPWALHSTSDGRRLCAECFISYQTDLIVGLKDQIKQLEAKVEEADDRDRCPNCGVVGGHTLRCRMKSGE